jgi:hypothetical protein
MNECLIKHCKSVDLISYCISHFFRQATSDISKGTTMRIVRAIVLYYYKKSITLACCFVDLVSGHR